MTSVEADERLDQLKRRLFNDVAAEVPPVFTHILERYVPPTARTVAVTSTELGRHSVFWLDGPQFGGLAYDDGGNDSAPRIDGAVWPVSELRLATICIQDTEHDPATGQLTRWKRHVVFHLGGKELTFTALDHPRGTDRAGDFIDAVLLAMGR